MVGVVGVGHVCVRYDGCRTCVWWVWWVKDMLVAGVVCEEHECIGCCWCRTWV